MHLESLYLELSLLRTPLLWASTNKTLPRNLTHATIKSLTLQSQNTLDTKKPLGIAFGILYWCL